MKKKRCPKSPRFRTFHFPSVLFKWVGGVNRGSSSLLGEGCWNGVED